MARDDDLWMPPPDAPGVQPLIGYPPYHASPVPSPVLDAEARRRARKVWLERRFPGRRATEVKGVRVRPVAWSLLLVGVVGFAAWVLVRGFPDTDAPPPPAWAEALSIAVGSVLVVACVWLAVITRRPPGVSPDDVWFLTRLSGAERRALIADMRSPEPPDPDELDVVAAAWLKEREHVLLVWPVQTISAMLMILRWSPGFWTVLPVVMLVLATYEVADGVPRLLAARSWLRRARA